MSPYLKIYDGTTDPEDHIINYVIAVKGNDLSIEKVPSVLWKKFGETLTGGALTWYSQLPARSIATFEEMVDKFVTAHAEAKKVEVRVNDIFTVRQMHNEGLRDFLARFNRVRMSLPNVSLKKYPPTTWEEIHNAYCAEIRADKDDLNGLTQRLTSLQAEARKDRRNDGRRDQLGPRLDQERHQPYIRMSAPSPPRHTDAPPDIQHHIDTRKGHLKELLSDRGRANFARRCEQPQGPPKLPSPTRTIQMIIGGVDGVAINHVKFTTTHKLKRPITHERYDDLEDSIIFDKLDAGDLSFPHYDALVITLRITDTDVKIIMVDDGSDACIIHPRVLVQMRLKDKIILHCITLIGFNNAVERTSREIVLLVLARGVTLETIFHVMNQETTYNAIIGRSWIHAMRAVSSSLYQVIKFPTPWGIFSIQGEKRTAQECYRIAQDCAHTQQLKGVGA
uniref:Retrotransposon gag domain-containing protein n=2 Tax=Nicotiana TaxID=4085 RepID=A0A1S4AIM3_TOBAC|nr:PREDICTED: uncharacterized protein LOC104222447 [Nicotiana sylvestris]XP_016476547.1 PREDICTED: uncharacterized protein LOC107798104 [Nicotiana tabacum]